LVEDDPDPGIAYDGPLIILTSRFSASASEILAGALQDYGRALIVGDLSTHGKGTVQNVNPLAPWVRPMTPSATNDPGALKLTIRKFYRVGGASTQLKGVLSDIVLPDVLNYDKDIGESSLPNALAWDTIPSADFEKIDMVSPYLPELLKRSSERLATNQDFKYIREDIDQYRKLQADKTVSLNEDEDLKLKREADARKAARDKEREARPPTNIKVYDLKLADVDKPGPGILEVETNAVSDKISLTPTNKSAAVAADSDEEQDDAKVPQVDPTLDETERILADYISLMNQKGVVANH
jgi:carboxyl-terminal processing protease